MKHYCLKGSRDARVPSLLFEIKIDLQDVRSGYRFSDWGLFLKALWLEENDLDWTSDMVVVQDPSELEEVVPDTSLTWPELADQKMAHYLIRYYHPRAWQNRALGLFSMASESREEFVARCRDTLHDPRERDLKKVREVYFHRIVEMEPRLIRETEQEEMGEAWRARRIVQIQDVFNEVRESLSRDLLSARQPVGELPRLVSSFEMGAEMTAQLEALRREFVERYNDVLTDYERQANEVEPYEVPLAYSHIEIVSRSVVWE